MPKTTQNKTVDFGKVVGKVVISPKVEIHVKDGARTNGNECVYIAKHINTRSYRGYAKGGLMIPKTVWKDFMAACRKVK